MTSDAAREDLQGTWHVAVVGAGVAGLSCARVLAARGIRVTVFESAPAPGGRLAALQTDGGLHDAGAPWACVRSEPFAREIRGWADADVVRSWPAIAVEIDNSWIRHAVEKKDKLSVFSNTSPLSSSETLSTLPNNFGFGIGDRSSNSDTNLLVWAKGDNTLAVLVKENSIIFSSLATPSATGNILSINDSYSVGRQIISQLFGKEIESTLINQNVVYYRTSRIYASPSAADKADLVRVSFYQSINNYPVVSISETGAVFTLYIDRALNLHSMSVIGGYKTISQGIELNITPFSEAEKNFDLALRINTSPDLGSNFKTASNTQLNLTTTKVQLAYMLIGNTFSPVYLLSGSLRGTTAPIQEGLYVIPAAQTN